MSKFLKLFLIGAGIACTLIFTKPYWFSEKISQRWHDAWLSPQVAQMDPRETIEKEHRNKLALIEKELNQRITREKARNQKLQEEYRRLKQGVTR